MRGAKPFEVYDATSQNEAYRSGAGDDKVSLLRVCGEDAERLEQPVHLLDATRPLCSVAWHELLSPLSILR